MYEIFWKKDKRGPKLVISVCNVSQALNILIHSQPFWAYLSVLANFLWFSTPFQHIFGYRIFHFSSPFFSPYFCNNLEKVTSFLCLSNLLKLHSSSNRGTIKKSWLEIEKPFCSRRRIMQQKVVQTLTWKKKQ